jgi:hypothetical protein
MADEAKVVGISKGFWRAGCLNCDWRYNGICREVDMAMRGHVSVSGHDANAWNEDKKLMLRLERDVMGRVVHRPDAPEPIGSGWTLNGAMK